MIGYLAPYLTEDADTGEYAKLVYEQDAQGRVEVWLTKPGLEEELRLALAALIVAVNASAYEDLYIDIAPDVVLQAELICSQRADREPKDFDTTARALLASSAHGAGEAARGDLSANGAPPYSGYLEHDEEA